MNRRLDVLAEVREPKRTGTDLEAFPMIALVIDQRAEALANGLTWAKRARDGRAASLLRLLVEKGRAAAVVSALMTRFRPRSGN